MAPEPAVRLYAIGDLLGFDFFIPAYQRGYRWDEQQVKDLLDDIHEFSAKLNKKPNEFYCLQPIVVVQRPAGALASAEGARQQWEVVDGQQRLTTIRIILEYLMQEYAGYRLQHQDIFGLHYETREDTQAFLRDISTDSKDSSKCIDFCYISEAYKVVQRWFKRPNAEVAKESMLQMLLSTGAKRGAEGIVQVIWYELPMDENPIESFTRINLGKIPLTNAELIKALFLQSNGQGPTAELGKLRQLEIATEWDRMENTLQNDDVWWFLNRNENAASARIEFIFDIIRRIACRQDPKLAAKIGSDEHATFRYYYQRADQDNVHAFVQQEWAVVASYFNKLLEWYNHPEWYHYVGFLIHEGERLEDLLGLYAASTKDAITAALRSQIAARLADVKWTHDANRVAYLDLAYGNQAVRRVLLLFNLQEVIGQRRSSVEFARFPFKTFKQEKWDIEHIDSSSENPLASHSDRVSWLEAAQHDLPELARNSELKQRILNFLAKPLDETQDDFQALQQSIAQLAGEQSNDEQAKNNIGNLTLLDEKTNRSYGNALFVTKRRVILKNDSAGEFIPPCTKQVFLKYFDQQGIHRTSWGPEDIRAYRTRIATALEGFLPAKPINN
jgi:hypothetical protein